MGLFSRFFVQALPCTAEGTLCRVRDTRSLVPRAYGTNRSNSNTSCSSPNLRPFIHSALVFGTGSGSGAAVRRVFRKKTGVRVGSLKRVWTQSVSLRLPTLRFRAKVMLGFAVVLTISAVSMGIAYLGFEHVSVGVASYRKSVSEADLARNIDRELISYRSLAHYYVVTGKEEEGKVALGAAG